MRLLPKLLPFLVASLLLSSCGHEKLIVDVCFTDPDAGGLDCVHHADNSRFFVKFSDAANYLAFSPQDTQTLLNYVATCKGK